MLASLRAHDTSPAADEVELRYWRSLSPSERAQRAFELSDLLRETMRAGIRLRHPEYSPTDVESALVRAELADDALFRRAWPDRPLLAP